MAVLAHKVTHACCSLCGSTTCWCLFVQTLQLSMSCGGSVTLGDEEARRRGSGKKSVLERAQPPTFDAAVELLGRRRWRVHANLAAAVDRLLAGAASLSCSAFLLSAHTLRSGAGRVYSTGLRVHALQLCSLMLAHQSASAKRHIAVLSAQRATLERSCEE